MIRPSSSALVSHRLVVSIAATRNNRGGVLRSSIANHSPSLSTHRVQNKSSAVHHHYVTTSDQYDGEEGASSSSSLLTNNKRERMPFLNHVDKLMKRDYPKQYEQYLQSKLAFEQDSRRREIYMQQQQKRKDDTLRNSSRASPLTIVERKGGSLEKQRIEHIDEIRSNNMNLQHETDASTITAATKTPQKLVEEEEESVPWFKRRRDIANYEPSGGYTSNKVNLKNDDLQESTTNLQQQKDTSQGGNNNTSSSSFASTSSSISSSGGGGIFSSISKQSIQNNNKNTSSSSSTTRIPLSELFPTLYANNNENNSNQKEPINKKRVMNKAMMYNTNHYESYEEALHAVLNEQASQKSLQKLSGKRDKKYNKFGTHDPKLNTKIVSLVKNWLLNDHRIVERNTITERWKNVQETWDDGKQCMSGIEQVDDGDENIAESSKFMLELKEQQEVFLSKLLKSQNVEEGTTHDATTTPTISSSNDGTNNDDTSNDDDEELTLKEVDPIFFYAVTISILSALGRYCARRARSSPMIVAWSKIKESGCLLPKETISTYLYVCGTMGMSDSIGISSTSARSDAGAKEEEEEEEDRFLIPEEVATYHDLSSKPTESSISLRVKALASKGDGKSAEELLEAFKKSIGEDEKSTELIRLRTYLPILKHYCDMGEISDAMAVFKRMQSTQGVILEPETYVLLIASIAENKLFCENSSPIDGVQDLGYTHSHGPGLFDELASEMADDALEISSSSARRLYNSLAIGFQSESPSSDCDVVANLKQVHPLMSMPLSTQPAKNNEVVACRVSLDRSTGLCEVTNAQQRLMILEPDQRVQLHDDLLNLSTEQFAKFAGKRADDSLNRAREQLQQFSYWLDKRVGDPFTAIIDGANVGYYMQSFDKGRFNYHQIKFMVDTLEERGENALVVIPNKYGYSQFYSSKREHQRLDQTEIEIMKGLDDSGKLYKVPPRCLDDFYWMLASISDQTTSRNGQDLSVLNNDPNGRFPGTRPMLITNDQMRDHRFELLEPRLFRRWYGCHIVNYNFTAFVLGESTPNNEIGFSQADFFSREIQGNPCSASDEENQWGGQAWHFPVNDWELDERFVIRIPVKKGV